jgi:3-oxoisoapionate decarboxylase
MDSTELGQSRSDRMGAGRLGLGTFGVAWSIGVPGYPQPSKPLDAFGVVDFAHELGLSLVQFGDNLPLHLLSDEDLRRLREHARERGIAFELGMRGLQSPDFERYIELTRFFDASLLRVVVDTATHHPGAAEIIDLVNKQISALDDAGITLAIENHDRFKAETLARIIKEINHPHVGVCLDTVNSFGSLEGSEFVVQTLGRYVVCLHVKEFVIKRMDHNMGFVITGAPTGQGMLDVPSLLYSLKYYKRSFNAIIETWLAPLPDMDETAALEQEWVRESVRYLRTLITE